MFFAFLRGYSISENALARASRYANDVKTVPDENVWQPVVDCGDSKFQFALFGKESEADACSDALLFPVEIRIRPAFKIALARRMPGTRRSHQMRGPVDIGRDVPQTGVLEFLKDGFQ